MAHHTCGNVLKHLYLLCGQRYDWGYNYRFAGMDAQRVKVFHRHDSEAMVVGVAYDLKFNLFPAFKGFLDKNLL